MDCLQNRLYLRVDGNVRRGNAIDQEFLPLGFGKVEETADVVVLIVSGKHSLRFCGGQTEVGKGHLLAIFTGVSEIKANEFA